MPAVAYSEIIRFLGSFRKWEHKASCSRTIYFDALSKPGKTLIVE